MNLGPASWLQGPRVTTFHPSPGSSDTGIEPLCVRVQEVAPETCR